MNISIIGIGRLGLCAALTMESRGFNVLGVDRSRKYVDALNANTFHSLEPKVNDYLGRAKNFKATTRLSDAVQHADILMCMVATPSLPNGFYDHAQVDRVVDALVKIGPVQGKEFVICCTVTPGYTQTVQKRLRSCNYRVSYSPEFIAQGNIIEGQLYPDMVLIGSDNEISLEILANVYGCWCVKKGPINRMDSLSAEICKIALNCFVTTKIAYANMVGDLANVVGANHAAILKAIGDDTRIGPKYLKYGHGFGGPCFPRDGRAFAQYCRENGIAPFISEATDKSNRKHLDYFGRFQRKCLDKKTVADMDVGYKPGSPIIEESQQLALAVELAEDGYKIRIAGHVAAIKQVKKLYGKLFLYA